MGKGVGRPVEVDDGCGFSASLLLCSSAPLLLCCFSALLLCCFSAPLLLCFFSSSLLGEGLCRPFDKAISCELDAAACCFADQMDYLMRGIRLERVHSTGTCCAGFSLPPSLPASLSATCCAETSTNSTSGILSSSRSTCVWCPCRAKTGAPLAAAGVQPTFGSNCWSASHGSLLVCGASRKCQSSIPEGLGAAWRCTSRGRATTCHQ